MKKIIIIFLLTFSILSCSDENNSDSIIKNKIENKSTSNIEEDISISNSSDNILIKQSTDKIKKINCNNDELWIDFNYDMNWGICNIGYIDENWINWKIFSYSNSIEKLNKWKDVFISFSNNDIVINLISDNYDLLFDRSMRLWNYSTITKDMPDYSNLSHYYRLYELFNSYVLNIKSKNTWDYYSQIYLIKPIINFEKNEEFNIFKNKWCFDLFWDQSCSENDIKELNEKKEIYIKNLEKSEEYKNNLNIYFDLLSDISLDKIIKTISNKQK